MLSDDSSSLNSSSSSFERERFLDILLERCLDAGAAGAAGLGLDAAAAVVFILFICDVEGSGRGLPVCATALTQFSSSSSSEDDEFCMRSDHGWCGRYRDTT
jgi:hypothetical protein